MYLRFDDPIIIRICVASWGPPPTWCCNCAGRYSSPLPSAGKRFAATLGELTGGRVGLTAGSLGVLKVWPLILLGPELTAQHF